MDDSTAATMTLAITTGDVTTLRQLLADHPGLASEHIQRGNGTRTPLHIAADWPGYFPEAPAAVRILIAAGADPSARTTGGANPETPLHWAASSDDVEVAEELINGGADIEAPGGSIGSPLDNAVGYGCWNVARLLAQHGACVDKLWPAAALGMMSRVEELLAQDPAPDEISEAFWQACHGGQRRTAELLLARGADLTWTPEYASETPTQIAAAPDTRRSTLVDWLSERLIAPGGA
jgi:ankyrin repeat protein